MVFPLLPLVLLPAGAGCSRGQGEPEAAGPRTGPERAGEATIPDSALLEGLREGEYVIYFRHAATEAGGVNGAALGY